MRKFLMACAAAIACLSGQQALAETKVTLGYTAVPPFLAAYVAADQGYFKKNGLDVEMNVLANGGVIAQVLIANAIQIGGPTPTVLLQGNESGLDLVAIASAEKFPTSYNIGIVAGAESGIKTLKDLEGKKIGVPGLNGAIDVMVRKALKEAGVDGGKVTHVESGFLQMFDMLKSGQIDAVATADPIFGRIVGTKVGVPISDFSKVLPKGTIAVVYAATRKWASEHKKDVEAFRKSLAEANAFINDPANDAKVRESLAKYTKLPPPIVANLKYPTNLEPEMTPDGFAFWAETALEQKMITKPADPASLIFKP